MNLLSRIEAILFVASKPLSLHKIASALETTEDKVEEALETLKIKYNHDDSGIHVLMNGPDVQMATNPAFAEIVDGFLKYEISEELTKAQLETLTVIAYRGPVTRPELEQIRGVNCSVIIRNLLQRGLIIEEEHETFMLPAYRLSLEALSHLGIHAVEELPEYETLHAHEHIEHALSTKEE